MRLRGVWRSRSNSLGAQYDARGTALGPVLRRLWGGKIVTSTSNARLTGRRVRRSERQGCPGEHYIRRWHGLRWHLDLEEGPVLGLPLQVYVKGGLLTGLPIG